MTGEQAKTLAVQVATLFKETGAALVLLGTGDNALLRMKEEGLLSDVEGSPYAVQGGEVTEKMVRKFLWTQRKNPLLEEPDVCLYVMMWDTSLLIGFSRLRKPEETPIETPRVNVPEFHPAPREGEVAHA